MQRALFRINWLNLKRDRIALGLTFVLPLIFFSIFAFIFGSMAESSGSGGGGKGPTALRIAVVDSDQTDISRRFVKAIDDQDALEVVLTATTQDSRPFTRDEARQAVRTGRFPAAVIIPQRFGETFGSFGGAGPEQSEVEVIYDESNPIAQNTVAGLLQAAAMMAAPDVLMERGFDQLERLGTGGALTPVQKTLIDRIRPYLRGDRPWEELDATEGAPPTAATAPATAPVTSGNTSTSAFAGLVQVKTTGAREGDAATTQQGERRVSKSSIIAYYAAGIGVMFLLFSMAGASGFLLEQEEIGVLERLLTTNVGMTRLLLGSWLFFSVIGMAQLAVMFLFAALVFDLDLFTPNHLAGCIVMIVITSLAAAAFAMILATLARSRAQLGGMSTIIILIMSALGGSMVPRFVAPGVFEKTAPFTFNGWALDGFLNVFWYDDPTHSLLQSLATLRWPATALLGMTVAFLLIARLLARRWEAR